MNIGVFVSEVGVQKGYEQNVSGHLQVALRSCEVLSRLGHEVKLISTLQSGFVKPACMPAGLQMFQVTDGKKRGTFGWDSLNSEYSPINVFRQVFEIRRLWKRLKLDVLHLFGFEGTMKLGGLLGSLGVPTVMTLYGPISSRRWRYLYRRISRVVTATNYVKKECEAFGMSVSQIRHGIVRRFSEPRAKHPRRVLFWREGTEAAGVDLCARVFRELAPQYPDFSFDMALRPNRHEMPAVKEFESLPLDNTHVHRFPYPSGCGLDKLLSETMCAVLPFRQLSIHPQLAIAESLAYGVPTICSDVGSCPELVQTGINGVIVPVGDEAALLGGIRDLLDHPQKAKCMGQAAEKQLHQDWNWNTYGTELSGLYAEEFAC